MTEVNKIRVDDCICLSHIEEHIEIKDKILSLIDTNNDRSMIDSSVYNEDDHQHSNISKLDWDNCRDFSRPWVKIFLSKFIPSLGCVMKELAYKGIGLEQVWYQQYLRGSHHAWHIHEYHFTGVYYLEYPEGCAQTEICSPYSLKKQSFEMKEGDFIVFPSHWIHRSPANLSDRKTIISYNFNVATDNPEGYALGIEKIKGS